MLKGQFEVRPGQYPDELMGVFGQYVRAVGYLFEALRKTPFSVDHCSYPLLYLIRHSLEVGLKANIRIVCEETNSAANEKKLESHNLKLLLDEFVALVSTQGNMDPETLEYFLVECTAMEELVNMMPSASSFRYTKERNGTPVFNTEVLDIATIKQQFDRAHEILAYTTSVLYAK